VTNDIAPLNQRCKSEIKAQQPNNRPLSVYLHKCMRKDQHTAEKHKCICGISWTDKKDEVTKS